MKSSPSSLVRSLGLRYVVVITIANIIGSGVYKKVAPMADQLNSSGWVLIAWLIGGIITLFGALSNAEVAGLLADTGGEYVYYKKIYNRFFAFLFGWSLFTIIQTASISSLAYVFAQSMASIVNLHPMLTSLGDFSIGGVFYPFADFSIKMVAVLLIIILTLINTKSIKSGAAISDIILWMVYLGIGVIIIFGLTSPHANVAMSFDFKTADHSSVTVSALFTAMLAAFWAYQGWSTIGFIGGEVKDAKRNIPKGIAIGVFIVIGIYLVINMTYLALLTIPELKGINAGGNQIAAIEAVRVFWGSRGMAFISILILITTLGCTHATIYASARPYYGMAKEGLFFRSVARLNKTQVPERSLWLQCIWGCLLVFSGSFDQLTDMVIFAVFIYYGATAYGVFILRKRMPDAHRPYKVWGYPFVPAIVVLFAAGLFINTIITQPREAIFGMVLILTGVPMYYYFTRKNAAPPEIDNQ
ncbi:MAG: amino acid permease [Saprospiraceae bacterium]